MKNLKTFCPNEWAKYQEISGFETEKDETQFWLSEVGKLIGEEEKGIRNFIYRAVTKIGLLNFYKFIKGDLDGELFFVFKLETNALKVCELGEKIFRYFNVDFSTASLCDEYLYVKKYVDNKYYILGDGDFDYYLYLPSIYQLPMPQTKGKIKGNFSKYSLAGDKAYQVKANSEDEAINLAFEYAKKEYPFIEDISVLGVQKYKENGFSVPLSFQGKVEIPKDTSLDCILIHHWDLNNGIRLTFLD